MDFIAEIEKKCGKKAAIRFLPLQPGDVVETVADIASSGRSAMSRRPISIRE